MVKMSATPGSKGDNFGEGEPMQTDAVPFSAATYSGSSQRPDSRPIQEEGQHRHDRQRSSARPRESHGRGTQPVGYRLVNEEALRHLPSGIRADVHRTLRGAEQALDEAGITPETGQKKKPRSQHGQHKQSFPMPGSGGASKKTTTAGDKPWGDFFETKGNVRVQSFVGCHNLQIGDKNVFHYTMNNYPGAQKGKHAGDDDDDSVSHDPMTKDEQVEQIKAVTREVSMEEINLLSEHVGARWRRLGRTVGFSDGELDNINHDFKAEGLQEICYQMLRKWKERKGQEATVGSITNALLNIRQEEVVRLVFIGKATTDQH